jgi:hypothetical protein
MHFKWATSPSTAASNLFLVELQWELDVIPFQRYLSSRKGTRVIALSFTGRSIQSRTDCRAQTGMQLIGLHTLACEHVILVLVNTATTL